MLSIYFKRILYRHFTLSNAETYDIRKVSPHSDCWRALYNLHQCCLCPWPPVLWTLLKGKTTIATATNVYWVCAYISPHYSDRCRA